MQTVKMFLRDTRAATAIEYAMIAAGIAVAISTAVATLSGQVQTTFNSVDNAMK